MTAVFTSLTRHWRLVAEMTQREILGQLKGSFGGLAWPLLQPLLLLAVFAFVFGEIMKVKWVRAEGTQDFVLLLYCGLIVFNLFGECLQRAPSLLVSRPNLVKKIVFPLEALAWVQVLQALFTFALSLLVLLIFTAALRGGLPWTVVFIPVVILPVVLAGLAVSWLVGAAAVFVRDVAQLVGPLVTALLFLSPVFFDLDAVPPGSRTLFALNPLTPSIEQMRGVLLDGKAPDVVQLGVGITVAYLFAFISLWFFRRAKEDYADAL
jgi:lipopolysaccharide transport system permease protein